MQYGKLMWKWQHGFKEIAKQGSSGNRIGVDSSDDEEEVNVLSCEWDDCDEDFTELKMLMSHVRDHVENELPTVSHEDDERLGMMILK